MDFQDVVRHRRMVRDFTDEPVSESIVERILCNALRGPSAGFTQGTELMVFHGLRETTLFWSIVSPDRGFERAGWPGIYRAPVVIVPLAHEGAYIDRYAEPDKGWIDRDAARWPVPFWHVDAAFATMLMLLTAVDARLGALFFGIRDHDAFRLGFNVPTGYVPIGAIAIGYPGADRPSRSLARGRRSRGSIIHRATW